MAFYEYLHIKDCWFKTGIVPTIDTRIEVDNAGFNSNWVGGNLDSWGACWPGLIGCCNSDWDSSTFMIKGSQYTTEWDWKVGNKDQGSGTLPSVSFGSRYNVSLDKNYFTVDGTQYAVNATSFTTNNYDIWLATNNFGGVNYRNGDIFAGNIRIYQSGVLVLEWIPTFYNGEYTYYDTVSQTYATKYGSGTIEAGPSLTTFEPSQDSFSFDYTGGSETFTVEADNTWTSTTPTYFTVSPLSGSAGTTTVTVTAGATTSQRSETVTFTDSETNTFDISITQTGDDAMVPFKKIIIGTRRIN